MEEYIDRLNRKGEIVGQKVSKSEAHQKGYYHQTVHLWLLNPKGEVLLQQRSRKKKICPLLWDVSIAGHMHSGESKQEALMRETQEEIGVSLNQFHFIKTYLQENYYPELGIADNEFHHVYWALLDVPLHQLIPDENEVESLKFISLSEFDSLLKWKSNHGHFVKSNELYYKELLRFFNGLEDFF